MSTVGRNDLSAYIKALGSGVGGLSNVTLGAHVGKRLPTHVALRVLVDDVKTQGHIYPRTFSHRSAVKAGSCSITMEWGPWKGWKVYDHGPARVTEPNVTSSLLATQYPPSLFLRKPLINYNSEAEMIGSF